MQAPISQRMSHISLRGTSRPERESIRVAFLSLPCLPSGVRGKTQGLLYSIGLTTSCYYFPGLGLDMQPKDWLRSMEMAACVPTAPATLHLLVYKESAVTSDLPASQLPSYTSNTLHLLGVLKRRPILACLLNICPPIALP